MAREITLVNTYPVARPPAEVFPMVIDIEREGTWAPTVEKVELVSGRPSEEGALYRYYFSIIGRDVTCDYRMHDVGDRRFTLTFERGPSWLFKNSITYLVEKNHGDSTIVTLTTRITDMPWFLRILQPLVVWSIERDYAEYERCATRYFESASA